MYKIELDGKKQKYIEWEQAEGYYKRVWIQHRSGEKDWAGTGRYLNVVRCSQPGRVGGNATDFPIWNNDKDEDILYAFLEAMAQLTE